MKLSYSSISKYESCPFAWKLRYVDKVPQAPKHYFSFGKAVHSALERMYEGEECPPLEEVLEAFRGAWSDAGYKDAKAVEKAKALGVGMLTDHHRAHAVGWAKPFATELKFDMVVDHVRVTGFIDRVDLLPDGTAHVLDYKTGRELEQGRIEEDPQLTMYQIAVEEMYGLKVGKLTLFHVPTNTPQSCGRHSDQLADAWRARIKATADAIAAQKFAPRPTEDACKWCDHKALCPAWGAK